MSRLRTTGPRTIAGVGQASGLLGALKQILDWLHQLHEWHRSRTRWTVSITSNNRLYDVAHRWFTDIADGPEPRALNARLQYTNTNGLIDFGSSMSPAPRPARVEYYYDVKEERSVEIGGHPVVVSMQRPDSGSVGSGRSGDKDGEDIRSLLEPETIYFHARSREGMDAVKAMLDELVGRQNDRRPALYLLTNWGSWSRRDDLPARPLDSVVLAEGQMERISEDLERFLASENEYVRRGQPWHRGYLLYGPPGTGKTSLVRALSAHFGLDLWYAPLGDLTKDASLLSLVNEVSSRSILLLEDVDIFHAARERDDEQAGSATMAGLLNALDGVATPHGLITVMTTNDRSVLDEALLRPGRVDLREEIGMPTCEQVCRLWARFFGYDDSVGLAYLDSVQFRGSTAEVTELCRHSEPTGAEAMAALCGSEFATGGIIRNAGAFLIGEGRS